MTSQGVQITIRGRGDDLVTQVIHCVAEHRIRVIDFRVERPTLEDVFLKLTGRAIRDEEASAADQNRAIASRFMGRRR